jgi:type II secretory pathway pseudopilin PulG
MMKDECQTMNEERARGTAARWIGDSSLVLHRSSFRRGGYSFPEVLFAVIVLGIGLIMIAAIFPVAIAQNKATVDETTASSIARSAASVMASLAIDTRTQTVNPPSTVLVPTGTTPANNYAGVVRPIDSLVGWNAIRGNLIFVDDPRYAFVPLYRRDGNPADSTTWAGRAPI